MERTEWPLLRGLAAPNQSHLELSADLLGRHVRESSRTAAPTGSGWSSPADQARNSPVPSPAASSCPTERVWRAGDREHAGARNDSPMAVRHPEAAAESWARLSPQDDRDESGRRPGDHHLPFVTEGSPRPGAICLALSAMRPSVPTPATNDSAASAPLRHLPRLVTGIEPVTRPSSCVSRGKQGALLQCPNDWLSCRLEPSPLAWFFCD